MFGVQKKVIYLVILQQYNASHTYMFMANRYNARMDQNAELPNNLDACHLLLRQHLMSLQSSQLTSSVPDVILALQSLAAIVMLKGINTAIINATGTGSNRLFLILLGGDLFGHIPN